MIGIFILIALPIISSILGVRCWRRNLEDLCIFCFIVTIIFLIMFLFIIVGKTNTKQTIKRYNSIKAKIDVINSFPSEYIKALDTCYPEIRKEVDDINKEIDINKDNYENKVNGFLFSEEVAKLNKLSINE